MSETANKDLHSASSKRYEWLIPIMGAGKEEITDDNQQKGPKIPRVPTMFRNIQPQRDCYDPSVVSIGPYHHGEPKLKEMEELKVTYTGQLVKDSKKPIEEIYSVVEEVTSIAKDCYTEDARNKFDNEKFAQMMFLDGCFIVQFLFCLYQQPEHLKMSSHDAALVTKDLFLLENQLPYEVLSKLMSFKNLDYKAGMKLLTDFCNQVRAFPSGTELKEKVANFLCKLPRSLTMWNSPGPAPHQSAAHLLEIFHKQFCSRTIVPEHSEKSSSKNDFQMNWYRYYPAEELRNIGIRFKPSKTGLFTDVQFRRRWLITGSLYIPPLRIDNSTKSLLLNLVAYEACHRASNANWATSYVCFMDSLIDHPRDVQVLRSKGILLNTLGSDEQAAELFNQIANHLIPDPYAFNEVKLSIELEHRKVIKKWAAMWLLVYFNSPWTFIAFVAAAFTIILTAIQTYMALFPPKDR